ncbi:hypothetical protein DRO47_05295 [Candidatus Bathyarchaeota archaeon]|nr:MAG: hypothetical protein DRO47_05295 [Candidatus Bathyarchaeota archaeon]
MKALRREGRIERGKPTFFQPLKEYQQTFINIHNQTINLKLFPQKMKLNPIISEEIGVIVTTGNLSKTILFPHKRPPINKGCKKGGTK